MVGLTRVELVTSRLSGERSNQLSYRPYRFDTRADLEESAPEDHVQRHAFAGSVFAVGEARPH